MEEELANFRAKKQNVEKENGLSIGFTSLFNWRAISRNETDPRPNLAHLSEPRRIEEVTKDPTDFVVRSTDVEGKYSSTSSSSYDNCLRWTSFILKCLLWLILMFLFVKLEFGAVFFVFSLLYFICTNLKTSPKVKGELSAYSVFNPNFERLDGTLTADQFEREIRFGALSVH